MFGLKVRPDPAPGEGLGRASRRRLERFSEGFDEIDARDLVLFAGPSEPDRELELAMERADQVLGSGRERGATKAAVQAAIHAAQVRFVEDFSVTRLIGLGTNRVLTADDRVRVFRSLERVVVALIVWDRLSGAEQAALVGPWREMVERAVEGA
ncbi:MAG TPA: hypothetical protein VKR30_03450 [Candidatus Limnocylindrales bacterium]|nr:hypothetical protein [Candidatus Limnocylindrales bacterium]